MVRIWPSTTVRRGLSENRRWSVYVVIFILCCVACGSTATSLQLPDIFPGDQSPCVKTKYRVTDKRSRHVIANTTTIQVNVSGTFCLEDHGFRVKYGSLEWQLKACIFFSFFWFLFFSSCIISILFSFSLYLFLFARVYLSVSVIVVRLSFFLTFSVIVICIRRPYYVLILHIRSSIFLLNTI